MLILVSEIASRLDVSVARVNTLLRMAGLQSKIDYPRVEWVLTEEGRKLGKDGFWSEDVIPILQDLNADIGLPPESTRLTEVDMKRCENCGLLRPYYDFGMSMRRERGDLTRWCLDCLQAR